MFIKEIRLRNFRSILKSDLALNNINIFVGQNDVGKSNLLKALNLFFNGFTDYSTPFSFTHDFCQYTVVPQKKAPEIIIELVINAPKNYKDSKDIVWRKTWRRHGLIEDEISFYDGTTFPRKSKLYSWLQNLRYTYVPAVRGTSYFEILLAQLHDTLVETVEGEIRNAGDQFINKIESNTKDMILEINSRISIESKIRFPSNLQTLFRTLEFSTTQGTSEVSLNNRGDGIKTRHIPVILKFIADQLNVNRVQGSPNISMIWGYEEPENNLELKASFNLANDFAEYSETIQLLVTTHSPSFYALKSKRSDEVNLYKVLKEVSRQAEIQIINDHQDLNEDMGILPIVTPYIDEKVKEVKALSVEVTKYKSELKKVSTNIIFVEGGDEVRVFEKILTDHGLFDKISVRDDGFGCSGVKNQVMAWAWVSSISPYKAIGIFDNDESGKRELKKVKSEEQFKAAQGGGRLNAIELKIPPHLQNIRMKIPDFPCEIEEMYSPIVWKKAMEYGWLEERSWSQLKDFITLDNQDQTISQKITSMQFNSDELLYIKYAVPDRYKEKLSRYCCTDKDEISANKISAIRSFFETKIKPFLEK
jgi:predicted ATP-dependent endonuclease of OLD family